MVEVAALCSLNALLAYDHHHSNHYQRARVAWPLLSLRRYWHPCNEDILKYRFQIFLRIFLEEEHAVHIPVLLESFIRLLAAEESNMSVRMVIQDSFLNECIASCGSNPDLIKMCIQALPETVTAVAAPLSTQEEQTIGAEIVSGIPRSSLSIDNCSRIAQSLQHQYTPEWRELLGNFDLTVKHKFILKID